MKSENNVERNNGFSILISHNRFLDQRKTTIDVWIGRTLKRMKTIFLLFNNNIVLKSMNYFVKNHKSIERKGQ